MPPSRFDRHYEMRRNRRRRDLSLMLASVSLLVAGVLFLDPLVSGARPRHGVGIAFILLCIVFVALTLFFHLRFLSRE